MTRKTERPLYLDMPFDEALTRYVGSKPDEVQPPPGKQRKAARPKPGGQVVNADALPETGEPPKPD